MIGGVNTFFTHPFPALGIPSLKMSDGPLGVHDYGPTAAYPGGIALAASWDVDLARRVGDMMGKDARARGVHFILGPGINIYRAPMNGRNFEYFGEDPFLASRMAVSVIKEFKSKELSPPSNTSRRITKSMGVWKSALMLTNVPCARFISRHLKPQ